MAGLRRGWALLADHKTFQQTGGKKFTPSHIAFRSAGKNHKHKTSGTKPSFMFFPCRKSPRRNGALPFAVPAAKPPQPASVPCSTKGMTKQSSI